MAEIIIPTPLRKYSGDQARVRVEASTVGESIRQLLNQYPELGRQLTDQNNALRNFVRIFIGEEDIRDLHGLDTEVKSGDTISIIPAIAGG